MAEDDQIFRKTEKGQAEIASPGGKLSPKQRRCLILVDGTKDAAALSAMFRPGEVNALLDELAAGGFIEAESGAAPAPAAAASASGPPSVPHPGGDDTGPSLEGRNFEAIRAKAAQEVAHRLGPHGDLLTAKLEASKTPNELRTALRDTERTLDMYLGGGAGKAFLRKLGLLT